MSRYDPEQSLRELRDARKTRDAGFREMARYMDRAAGRMRELWPDPEDRETAGLGAVAAAATVGAVARAGAEATMVNLVGLLGQALVDDARTQMGVDRG